MLTPFCLSFDRDSASFPTEETWEPGRESPTEEISVAGLITVANLLPFSDFCCSILVILLISPSFLCPVFTNFAWKSYISQAIFKTFHVIISHRHFSLTFTTDFIRFRRRKSQAYKNIIKRKNWNAVKMPEQSWSACALWIYTNCMIRQGWSQKT